MDVILISILLYLSLIFSPSTHTQAHIDALEAENHQQIDAIRADQPLTDWIVQEYEEEVQFVIVADTNGEN